jgi:hypothetical protein
MGFGFGPIPTFAQSLTAAPTGTASGTLVMLGLNTTITPTVTGRVRISACGTVASGTTNDGGQWQLSYGTGGAPSNGAAVTGTQVGSVQVLTADLAATDKYPFAVHFTVQNPQMTLGTTYWIDLAFSAISGGTFSMTNVLIEAFEM